MRVLLVNEQPVVCQGVRSILENIAYLEVVGEAYNGQEAQVQVDVLQPDMVVLACTLPDMSGADLVSAILQRQPAPRVLVYSRISEDEQVKSMLVAGAMGYALTTDDLDTLVNAIRALTEGQVWISPSLEEQIYVRINEELATTVPLTEREQEILRLIGEGLENREIAEALFLEWQTVKNYVSRVYKKLGVSSRPQAILRAIHLGLVDIKDG